MQCRAMHASSAADGFERTGLAIGSKCHAIDCCEAGHRFTLEPVLAETYTTTLLINISHLSGSGCLGRVVWASGMLGRCCLRLHAAQAGGATQEQRQKKQSRNGHAVRVGIPVARMCCMHGAARVFGDHASDCAAQQHAVQSCGHCSSSSSMNA
jgi:hypothetical protein